MKIVCEIDFPQLQVLRFGVSVFCKSHHTVIQGMNVLSCMNQDLPALQEILLQINALAGKECDDCSLVLRSKLGLT